MKLLPIFKNVKYKAASKLKSILKRPTKLDKANILQNKLQTNDQESRRKRESYYSRLDEVEEHFQELIKTIDIINNDLETKNKLYRFDAVKNGTEIYIEVIFIDKEGGIIESQTRKITHQNFQEIIADIDQGEGLLFEASI